MYLSFDIGIKNLAYCLMDTNLAIKDWGIIDLTNGPQNKNLCNYLGIGGCKHPGKFCNLLDKSKFYCGVHCKKVQKDELLDLDKIRCSTSKCKFAAKLCNPEKTIYACKKHSKNLGETVEDVFQKGATKIPILELGRTIFKRLKDYPQFLEADYIIIENQPVLKNPTMKSVQMILFSFFISNESSKKKFKNVALVSASNKLKVFKGEINPDIKNIKDKYKRNKAMAIEHCLKLLEENCELNNSHIEFFNNYKSKRDDLADAYLMCRWFKKQPS